MALKKAIELESGGSAEYWRVAPGFMFDVVTGELHARVYLYVNEIARRADKFAVMPGAEAPNTVTLTGADAQVAVQTGDPRAALYGVLKALPYFAGAQDV